MKQKKEKKLCLSKETLQDLSIVLERDEQKWVKGGVGITQVPVFC